MVYLYIIKSLQSGHFYVGITKNVEIRLEKHNKGGVRSTKKGKPYRVILTEEYAGYPEARKREIEIKSYKGGLKFKELLRNCRVV